MFFPTAGIEVDPWIPPLVAFGVSFFTSMGGVSGAFLLLPFQMNVLGYVHPSVSATNHVFNVTAIPAGVYRYLREGRMVWPLTWVVILGTLPGVFVGSLLRVVYLPDPRHFKLFVGLVLLYIGARMVWDLVRRPAPGEDRGSAEKRFHSLVKAWRQKAEAQGEPLPAVRVTRFSKTRIAYEFYGEAFEIPSLSIFALSLAVGLVGGTYGIGGGAIIAPFLVSFFGLPVYTVAGAALMGTCVTSVAGVLFFQLLAPFFPGQSVAPDYLLGVLFGLGGATGMYLGARCQKLVPASVIKWGLGALILWLAVSYLWGFAFR